MLNCFVINQYKTASWWLLSFSPPSPQQYCTVIAITMRQVEPQRVPMSIPLFERKVEKCGINIFGTLLAPRWIKCNPKSSHGPLCGIGPCHIHSNILNREFSEFRAHVYYILHLQLERRVPAPQLDCSQLTTLTAGGAKTVSIWHQNSIRSLWIHSYKIVQFIYLNDIELAWFEKLHLV